MPHLTVPFHFKQWGHWSPESQGEPVKRIIELQDEVGSLERLSWRPKQLSGRILDGRTWDGYPLTIHPDPCPELIVERGPKDEGVGVWVPEQKHRLLCEYLHATRHAWKKWPSRAFIDPFAGPGRIQVKGEPFTRDGGAVRAWRTLADIAPFTHMLVGDINSERALAGEKRLKALGASVVSICPWCTMTKAIQAIEWFSLRAMTFRTAFGAMWLGGRIGLSLSMSDGQAIV